jgi:imidazoleglycerol-phosphate dehydratase
MKIAFLLFDGMNAMDFINLFEPLTRLRSMGMLPDLEWDLCAYTQEASSSTGLKFTPNRVSAPLEGYDLLVIPGGSGALSLADETGSLNWIKTAGNSPLKIAVGDAALVLGAAGFRSGRWAAAQADLQDSRHSFDAADLDLGILDEGHTITARDGVSAIDLGLYACARLAGEEAAEKIRQQLKYPSKGRLRAGKTTGELDPAAQAGDSSSDGTLTNSGPDGFPLARRAAVERSTNETKVRVALNLDGQGGHSISTGIGFLDHMLTHLAVHGLFDLDLQAQGDLHVDVHHTVEDVALTLGEAFSQALGARAGIQRMASASVPMDEALAFLAVDFSGRPYGVIEASWHGPQVGGIPCSLFAHFLESFAVTARCNLHARVLAGRDDHHQVEALFKALARALDAATQLDPRRVDRVPSTKGTLTPA